MRKNYSFYFSLNFITSLLLLSYQYSFGQSVSIDSGIGASWNVPTGATTVIVEVWGGGASGGGSTTNGHKGGGGGGRKAWRVAYTKATRLRCSRGTSRGAPLWTRHTTHAQQMPISGWRDQSATSVVHWNKELDKRRNGGRGVERGCGAARAQPQREASKTLQSYRPSSYRAIQRLFGKKTEQPQEKRNGTSEKKVS